MKNGRALTRKERAEISGLVKKHCANYDRTYQCCPLLDDYGCYMLTVRFAGSGLCKYFREAVLPLNPALQAVFMGGKTKPCKICGREFTPTGGRFTAPKLANRKGGGRPLPSVPESTGKTRGDV